ncbi:MAG: ribosome maturation factor RimM [Bacillota bacterium]|nr:ribosome maturation factor RimM [Bacillota bacterium]
MERKDLINVGKIVGTHGYKGTMKVEILTEFPGRFKGMQRILVDNKKGLKEYQIESSNLYQSLLLMKLKGIESKEEAQPYRGSLLCIQEENLMPLPEGAYYHFQLIGLDVIDKEKGNLGKLIDVMETGANDVYVVCSSEYGEILLPAIKQVILEVNLDRGWMRVKLLEGLLDS